MADMKSNFHQGDIILENKIIFEERKKSIVVLYAYE